MPVADTNLLIRAASGDEAAVGAIRALAEQEILVPTQVVAEFLVRIHDRIRAYRILDGSYRIVHTDAEHAIAMAHLARRAIDKGRRPRWADVHIAAVAANHDTYVVTANERHFVQLGVEAWDFARHPEPPT